MALPPTVPTSFVPKKPVATTRRAQVGGNLFFSVSAIIGCLALAGAGATFGYQKYLENVLVKKEAELKTIEQSISRATVEEFIRLRDRLGATAGLLDSHVGLSQFFDLLETLTLQNVQFTSLGVKVMDDRTAKIDMHGSARNFNALAAESAAFAGEKRIRRAIFSNISSSEKGIVTFSLSAELAPELVVWTGPSSAPVAQTETSVPATTSSVPIP